MGPPDRCFASRFTNHRHADAYHRLRQRRARDADPAYPSDTLRCRIGVETKFTAALVPAQTMPLSICRQVDLVTSMGIRMLISAAKSLVAPRDTRLVRGPGATSTRIRSMPCTKFFRSARRKPRRWQQSRPSRTRAVSVLSSQFSVVSGLAWCGVSSSEPAHRTGSCPSSRRRLDPPSGIPRSIVVGPDHLSGTCSGSRPLFLRPPASRGRFSLQHQYPQFDDESSAQRSACWRFSISSMQQY